MIIEKRHFPSSGSLIEATADLLKDLFTQGEGDAPYGIILPGGSTPLAAYARIAESPPKISRGLHLLLSDERHVPLDSPDSNCAQLLPMIRALHLPDYHLLAVETENDLESAARGYDQRIRDFLASGGKLPVGLLGLGEDGHTASLFSPEDVERSHGKYAVAVQRPSPPHRVSVSADVLALCERVIFLVSGQAKRAIREKLLDHPLEVTAGIAVQGCPQLEIWFSE